MKGKVRPIRRVPMSGQVVENMYMIVYPTEVALGHKANLPKESYVQLDNIQTISKDRFVKYLGSLDVATMRTVARKLILALGLEDVV